MDIEEILRPQDVVLALKAQTKAAAVEEVLAKLRGDERIADWGALAAAVRERDAPAISEERCAICIAHGRTAGVRELAMAAGRSSGGIAGESCPAPIKIVFVVGIPSTIESAYLRLVGALARVCRTDDGVNELLCAASGEEFVEILVRGAAKLD